MTFTSLQFLAFVLLAAFVAQFVRGAGRTYVLLAASIAFVATYIPAPQMAVPLAAFVLAGYGGVLLASSNRPRGALSLVVLALVGVFVWLKHYPFVAALPALPFAYTVVGISYILFRVLHLIFEVGDGALPRPPFWRYVLYCLFFPAFLSGPINRYQPFARDLDAPQPLDRETAFETLWRLLKGLAKVAVVGEILRMVQDNAASRLDAAMATPSMLFVSLAFAAATLLYMLYLYVNFSGYTDMAIAIARLFGIVLPENFNRPFMAINFQDFWSRWHITLSEWFKFYFFNPLLKVLMQRFRNPALAPYLGVVALFIVFLVLGAWHGASYEYLLAGALNGTGVSVNKLYQVEIAKRLGKKSYRALAARPAYLWASRGLSLSWCAFALVPFWLSVGDLSAISVRIGIAGLTLSILVMSACYAVGVFLVVKFLGRVRIALPENNGPRAALLAALMLFLAFAMPLIGTQGDFVYKAF